MRKLTVFAGSLVVALAALPAQAQQSPTAHQYCNAIAEYAQAVAKDRDNGTPEHKALDIASQHGSPRVRSDLVFLVQLVHTEPHLPPTRTAGLIFELCWSTYGDRA